jgi:ubiquinone/menaquinone biosynthesis C-methylase UbiE
MDKTLVEKHFDKIADNYDYYKNKNQFYYKNLKKLLCKLIPKNKTVLEFGCGTGDLLTSLNPKVGYGVDISREMIDIAKNKYKSNKNLHFFTNQQLPIINRQLLDTIFMSDVIEHLEKPKETFVQLSKLMDKKTVFICTMANPVWEPVLMIAEKLGLKMPEGPHIRFSMKNLILMINNSQLKVIKHGYSLLIPINIPIITNFANRYLEKYFRRLAFIEYFVMVKA